MSRLIFAALFLAATPAAAFAQPAGPPLPDSRRIQEMAPALDRMVDALLATDIGPILDAADPLGRGHHYGAPGRTLGAMARRDDPDFDRRVHASIYGGAEKLGRMSDALAAAAPVLAEQAHQLRHSLREIMHAWREGWRAGGAGGAGAVGDAAGPGGIPDDD
jgi:hypothetical protein